MCCELLFYVALPFFLPAVERMSTRRLSATLVLALGWGVATTHSAMRVPLSTAVDRVKLIYEWPPVHFGEFLIVVVSAVRFLRDGNRSLNQ